MLRYNKAYHLGCNLQVRFTAAINMASYTRNKSTPIFYDLVGVIEHVGGFNLTSGHYIAYIGNGNFWREFDDDKVRVVCPWL